MPTLAAIADRNDEAFFFALSDRERQAIRYPEFVERSTAAGASRYWTFLTGKRVVYFGRRGESHTEWFPGAKP